MKDDTYIWNEGVVMVILHVYLHSLVWRTWTYFITSATITNLQYKYTSQLWHTLPAQINAPDKSGIPYQPTI